MTYCTLPPIQTCFLLFAHAGIEVEIHQSYPETVQYRCHIPSIILSCNYSEEPVLANWFVSDNGNLRNCDNLNGHAVYNSRLQSILTINNTGVRVELYSCIVVDGNMNAKTETYHVPPYEGQSE